MSRKKILLGINEILERQGRQIADFPNFIRDVIGVYDNVFFDGQISEMAQRHNISNFPDVFLTEVKEDVEKGVGNYIQNESAAHKRSSYGVCDIIVIYDLAGDPKSIKFEFYNTFLVNSQIRSLFLSEVKKYQEQNGIIGRQYTLYIIMYVIEHILIHLLMILWKYHEKGVITPSINVNYKARSIYSTHGLLYRSLLKEYFGLSDGDAMYVAFIKYYRLGKSDETLTNAMKIAKQGHPGIASINPDKLGLIKWQNNSCFFDSLVVAILFGASSYMKDGIIKRNSVSGDYINVKNGKFKNPFPGKKVTSSPESTCQLSSSFREYFKTTFDKLLDGNLFVACSIRSILGSVDHHINSGEQYEPYMVYGALCNIYPHLKMERIPTIRNRNGRAIRKENLKFDERIIAFPMDDFVTLDGKQNRKGVVPLFDNISKEEHLAFFIQHPPWLKRWNEIGEEVINTITYSKTGEEIEGINTIQKIRAFDEYILGSKYRLYAVILHSGNTPKNLSELSFGHYTLLFRPFFDKDSWYYYDDLTPSLTKVSSGSIPHNAFVDTGKRRPHMFLYERLH